MNALRSVIILYACCSFFTIKAQQLTTRDLIKAWSTNNTAQTVAAEATYADLRLNANKQTFQQIIGELKVYLHHYGNNRLKVRTIMYDILGKHYLNIYEKLSPVDSLQIQEAMKLATIENDQQLLSEVFTLYAESIPSQEIEKKKLFYTLKAIDIQRRIGFQYFPLIYLRFLTASLALYTTAEYRQSITYGMECLQLMKSSNSIPRNYVFQYDILGASYRELNMPDSSISFYEKITKICSSPALIQDTGFAELWTGIASGAIAQSLVMKGHYNEAYPLLRENVRSCLKYAQFPPAAAAENTLAKIDYIKKDFNGSLLHRESAYRLAVQGSDLRNTVKALAGIREIYKISKMHDSAWLYNELYHLYHDSLIVAVSESSLDAVNAKIEFDNLQTSLKNAQQKIVKEKYIRNFILITTAFLAIIVLLLYNRKRLQFNLRKERLEKEKEIAQIEMTHANLQIKDFTHNISEKNRLIESLKTQLGSVADTETHIMLRNFTILTDEDWQSFRNSFEKINPGFWDRLNQKMFGLTTGEQRIMLLAKLGLTTKEMAAASGVAPETVRSVISRMRKKFNIPVTNDIRMVAEKI